MDVMAIIIQILLEYVMVVLGHFMTVLELANALDGQAAILGLLFHALQRVPVNLP
jgi:hypothetical protein